MGNDQTNPNLVYYKNNSSMYWLAKSYESELQKSSNITLHILGAENQV